MKLKNKVEIYLGKLSQQIYKDVAVEGREVIMDGIFHLLVGHDDNLTEKYAYDNTGKIPIYSGTTNNYGIFRYSNRIDYNYDDYITWAIDGKAGTMFHQSGSCSLARHCGIMIPKNKKEINLDWFILTQESALRNFAIGRGGMGYLKKNLIQLYPFKLPKRTAQDEIVKEYEKITELKKQLAIFISKIDAQLQKTISLDKDYPQITLENFS